MLTLAWRLLARITDCSDLSKNTTGWWQWFILHVTYLNSINTSICLRTTKKYVSPPPPSLFLLVRTGGQFHRRIRFISQNPLMVSNGEES